MDFLRIQKKHRGYKNEKRNAQAVEKCQSVSKTETERYKPFVLYGKNQPPVRTRKINVFCLHFPPKLVVNRSAKQMKKMMLKLMSP